MKDYDFEEIRASQEAGTHRAVQAEMNRELIAEFRSNRGELTGQLAAYPILLLTHVGAKSRCPYVSPLGHGIDGDDIVLVASLGGSDRSPSWYHNLKANPMAVIELGDTCFRVRARITHGSERDRLFRVAADAISEYDDYQSRTTRVLPVVVLERTGDLIAAPGGQPSDADE